MQSFSPVLETYRIGHDGLGDPRQGRELRSELSEMWEPCGFTWCILASDPNYSNLKGVLVILINTLKKEVIGLKKN